MKIQPRLAGQGLVVNGHLQYFNDNQRNFKPLQQMRVSLYQNRQELGRTFSDENGQYEFYLSLENRSYEVHSSVDSFCPYDGSFTIHNDYSSSSFIYNFSMSPIPEPGEIRMVLNWGESPRDLD